MFRIIWRQTMIRIYFSQCCIFIWNILMFTNKCTGCCSPQFICSPNSFLNIFLFKWIQSKVDALVTRTLYVHWSNKTSQTTESDPQMFWLRTKRSFERKVHLLFRSLNHYLCVTVSTFFSKLFKHFPLSSIFNYILGKPEHLVNMLKLFEKL